MEGSGIEGCIAAKASHFKNPEKLSSQPGFPVPSITITPNIFLLQKRQTKAILF